MTTKEFSLYPLKFGEKIDALEIEEVQKIDEYILERKPVVINGIIEELKDIKTLWSNSYFSKVIGDEQIEVEQRKTDNESFGMGHIVSMSFDELLKEFKNGNHSLYLTTQGQTDSSMEKTNQYPPLMSTFLHKLMQKTHISLELSLVRRLVPWNLNIWFGKTSEMTSSGLHHDFHDNIYVLLRGEKQITLISPREAHKMETFGKISKVFANGRIVYSGGGEVNPDGSEADAVALFSLKQLIQEKESKDDDTGLEELYDKLLEAELKNESSFNEPKRQKREPKFPESFSKIREEADLNKLLDLVPSATVKLKAGQMLFIPTGWFHEVKSLSPTNTADEEYSGHLALNYWYHPPDNKDLKQPYKTAYWRHVYNIQKSELAEEFT